MPGWVLRVLTYAGVVTLALLLTALMARISFGQLHQEFKTTDQFRASCALINGKMTWRSEGAPFGTLYCNTPSVERTFKLMPTAPVRMMPWQH